MMPSDFDIGWTAGIIDGEGSILLTGSTVRIRAFNTYLPIILKLQELWSGVVTTQQFDTKGRLPIYVWSASSDLAIAILETLLPHLCKKHKAAEWAMKFYRTIADARGRPGGLTEDDIRIRDLYREMISRANKKGG